MTPSCCFVPTLWTWLTSVVSQSSLPSLSIDDLTRFFLSSTLDRLESHINASSSKSIPAQEEMNKIILKELGSNPGLLASHPTTLATRPRLHRLPLMHSDVLDHYKDQPIAQIPDRVDIFRFGVEEGKKLHSLKIQYIASKLEQQIRSCMVCWG